MSPPRIITLEVTHERHKTHRLVIEMPTYLEPLQLWNEVDYVPRQHIVERLVTLPAAGPADELAPNWILIIVASSQGSVDGLYDARCAATRDGSMRDPAR